MGKILSNIWAQPPSRAEGLQGTHVLVVRAKMPRQLKDVQSRAVSQQSQPLENSNTRDNAKTRIASPPGDEPVLGILKELAKTINERMARMEQRLDSVWPPKLPEHMITTEAAMGILGYKDIGSFLASARQRRVFHTRINARKFCWSSTAIEEWKKARGVGRPPSDPSLSNSYQSRSIL